MYPAQVYMNGAKPIFVPFKQKNILDSNANDEFYIDYDELRKKITKKTKLMVIK